MDDIEASGENNDSLNSSRSSYSKDEEEEEELPAKRIESSTIDNWRRLAAQIQSKSLEFGADFFHSSAGARQQQQQQQESANLKGDNESDKEEEEEEQLLTKMMEPSRYTRATYWSTEKAESLIAVVDHKGPVTMEEKGLESACIWSPEEDGLYVGNRPEHSGGLAGWTRFERRLLMPQQQKTSRWFSKGDGSVAVLADPLRPYLIRNIVQPSVTHQSVYRSSSNETAAAGAKDLRASTAYPLHIVVSRLCFHHHWLFSREQALARRVENKLNDTQRYDHQSTVSLLFHKLNALYQAHDEALDLLDQLGQFSPPSGSKAVRIQLKRRITSYRQDIVRTRSEWLEMASQQKRAVKALREAWSELKSLRKSQGFAVTSVRLVKVHKEDDDVNTQQDFDWDQEIERQMEDAVRSFRAARKQKIRAKKDEEEDEEEEEEFDEEVTRQEICNRMKDCLATPGEKQVKYSLVDSRKNSKNPTDAKETKRTEAMSRVDYRFRILYNGEEKCISDSFKIGCDDASTKQQQAFNLWIRDRPRSLKVSMQFRSKSNHQWIQLAEILLPIPSSQCSFSANSLGSDQLEFVSPLTMAADSNLGSVGSSADSNESVRGIITFRIGWGTDVHGNIASPPNIVTAATQNSQSNSNKLDCDLIATKSQLDPNDPANADVFDLVQFNKKSGSTMTTSNKQGFDATVDDPSCWMSREELDANVRFQLLRQRADGVKPFSHLAMIPSRVAEIPMHLQAEASSLSLRAAAASETADDELINGSATDNPLDRLRRKGQRLFNRMQKKVTERLTSAESNNRKKLQLNDLVVEDHIPDITTFSGQLMPALFKPHRPLRPERKDRPTTTPLPIHTSDPVSLRVNIIRALNVPRKTGDERDSIVRPFVQVSFQKCNARTTAGKGSTPTWNQELSLPVELSDRVRPLVSTLPDVKDELFIQLFDEVIIDILDDDRQRELSVHQRLERRWLGGITIPFHVVYQWTKIEGTFALEMPFVPIGYEFVRSPLMEQQQERPLLTVLISLHPAVSWNPTCRALPLNCSLKSKEDQSLVDHINNWMTGLMKDYSNLNWIQLVNPLVVDQDGESVYLGRFLSPMQPPNDLIVDTDDDETLRNVCQFVAAIANPIQADDPMLPHIWQSCQTTLEWLTGGDQERAVLLFNYLIEFKFDVYLLLGMAVPQGQTAQILYRDKKETSILWLVNPSTGARTNAKDSTGHVQQVWALVNQSQFWVNVQQRSHPSQMQFSNLGKTSDWKPLFGRQQNHLLPSLRDELVVINYSITNGKDVRKLEDAIAEHLKQSFMKWRKTQRTKWNRHASQVLRKVLAESVTRNDAQNNEGLDQLLESYKVTGVPLRTAYSNVDHLSDLLFATGLHKQTSSSNEFALAVYAKTYPNLLLHVYIYCAHLEDN